MYTSIIEDYQRVITNPLTPPEVVMGLSETVRCLLADYRREIDKELAERRHSQQLEAYILRLREHEQSLLEELRDDEMINPSGFGEKAALLESLRSQIDQAVWPSPAPESEIAALRGDLEVLASYSEKLDTRIDNQNEIIEDLSIRLRMANDQINELQKKTV